MTNVRAVIGGLVGLVIGAIASINVVIFSGVEDGYETWPVDVFDENVLVGVAALIVLAAGPILGVIVALRTRPPAS